ncbi:MAG: sensor histidine kinase, partial [Blastocatellia bacterium]
LWAGAVMLLITIERSVIAKTWTPFIFAKPAIVSTLWAGLMVYGTIASVAYVLQVSSHLLQEQARAERAEALSTKAELKALRAQLNPHFLFNTLHSLMALVRRDPQAAEDALERFADMFRYALKAGREEKTADDDVSLKSEWNFVQNYLALEKLRLGGRLRVEAHIAPDSLDCAVPAFTLQPLVENAIKHAIAPQVRTVTVTIALRIEDDEVVIEVRDDGPGATRAALEYSAGFGLQAVRRRLELRYAGQAQFLIDTAPDQGVAVSIRIPVEDPPEGGRKDKEVK